MNNTIEIVRYMDSNEVWDILTKNNISKDTCDYIKKNNINGTEFLDLCEEDINSWEISHSSKFELVRFITNLRRNQTKICLNDLNPAGTSILKRNSLSRIVQLFKPGLPFSYLNSTDTITSKYTKFQRQEKILEMDEVKANNNLKYVNTSNNKTVEKTKNHQHHEYKNVNDDHNTFTKPENDSEESEEWAKAHYQQHPVYKNATEYQNVPTTLRGSLSHKYDYILPIPPKSWLVKGKFKQTTAETTTNSTNCLLAPDKRNTYIEISGGQGGQSGQPTAIVNEIPQVCLTINSSPSTSASETMIEKKKKIFSCTLCTHLICYSILTAIIVCFVLIYYL